MNRKNIPLILMLLAGAVTCIITYSKHYSLAEMLVAVFIALVVFWILGSVLEMTLNHFDAVNEAKRMEEGEVIEKDAENPVEGEGEDTVEKSEAEEP